nr:MAG TPA: hypothetical protein [Caudoviricetes sp.]
MRRFEKQSNSKYKRTRKGRKNHIDIYKENDEQRRAN